MTSSKIQVYCYLLLLCGAGCAAPRAAVQPMAKPAPAIVPVKSTAALNWSDQWTPLFNGSTLANWAVTDFAGHGVIEAKDSQINIGAGDDLSGINWNNGSLPRTNYEISLQAMKVDGGDFFCGLTFPVADSWCTLILGGWGGGVVGLSSLDGNDASENETTQTRAFDNGKWYAVKLRVTADRIQAWLDQDKIIDVAIAGRKVSLRPGPIDLCEPLGVATYQTSAALKDIKLRLVALPAPR